MLPQPLMQATMPIHPKAMLHRRVLVVDDEESNRTFVERVLTLRDFTVVTAADGDDALRIIEQQPPFDLFLLDVVMPRMQGDELARQIRQRDLDAKILYLTGYADKLFEQRQTLWENEAFLEKPISLNGLFEAVSLIIDGKIDGLPRTA